MPIQSFEFCSFSYLNFWISDDQFYCKAFEGDNEDEKLKALKDISVKYGIARNFPLRYDKERNVRRLFPVLKIIEKHTNSDVDTPEKIEKIAEEISSEYGGRFVKSATTKFLWLKFKIPVIIYDSQAKIALDVKSDDLAEFYAKWRESFNNNVLEIKKVCLKLTELQKYAFKNNGQNVTKEYIKSISEQKWFQERVFDFYLWNKGDI
jgi:hypothetical protein